MKQSEEVRDLLASLIGTFGTPRWGQALIDAVSAEPAVLMIGTDPAEWWDNFDDIERAMRAQSAELEGATATVTHSEGWVEGDVGWGAVKADAASPGGPAVMFRITATLARRPGGWKIVQAHASVGVANEEIAGQELTV